MRRMLCLMAAAAIAAVAALTMAPPSKAVDSHAWFSANVTLVAAGHTVVATGAVQNIDTIAHTGTVVLKVTGPGGFVSTLTATVSLASGASYTLRLPVNQWIIAHGTYTGTLTADHMLQRSDPIGYIFPRQVAQATLTV